MKGNYDEGFGRLQHKKKNWQEKPKTQDASEDQKPEENEVRNLSRLMTRLNDALYIPISMKQDKPGKILGTDFETIQTLML